LAILLAEVLAGHTPAGGIAWASRMIARRIIVHLQRRSSVNSVLCLPFQKYGKIKYYNFCPLSLISP